MNNRPFNARSDAAVRKSEPGEGDDVPCVKCGAVALDTGLECSECGHDNYEAVTGRPFGVSQHSDLNLWTRQWRAERIGKARADWRERASAYQCLRDKTTDYAKSLKMARDVCAEVLAVWERSPVDLPADSEQAGREGK